MFITIHKHWKRIKNGDSTTAIQWSEAHELLAIDSIQSVEPSDAGIIDGAKTHAWIQLKDGKAFSIKESYGEIYRRLSELNLVK